MTESDPTLEALAARLSAGEMISPELIPERLREHPGVQRLLALARVMGQLDANLASLDDVAPAVPATAAPDRLGAFRLVRALGTGGMGEVWLGERDDGEVEQRVAVKRVRGGDARFGERLRDERRILARLEHPNIARFIDAGVDAAGTPWLALEYVDGVPITDWCQQRNLGLAERLRLFLKVCAAVEHAHRHLVVHRDLKPSNILVNADGEPKLLDFGIARLLDGSMSEATQTALTPAYAAPEQLRGGAISTATDVYALGLVLFRLIAGTLPESRTGENPAQVLARLDDEETERPSRRAARGDWPLPYPAGALEGDLDAIVAQALRAEPARRYGSAAALAEDLERHLDSRPVLARAPTRWYRAGRFVHRNALAVGFASLAVLALVIGTAIALDQAATARQAAATAEREAEAARVAQARAERGQEFLSELFASASPETNRGRMPSVPELLADGAARVARSELPNADRAELAVTIAESWFALGDAAAAIHALATAARIAQPDQTRTWSRIALLLARRASQQGDFDTARAHYLNAATLARTGQETPSIEATAAELGLGNLALFSGDYPDALARTAAALSARTTLRGPDDPATLDAAVAHAVALIANDQLDAAITLFETTMAGADRRLGVPNAISCRAGTSLSDALERRGNYQRAADSGIASASVCRSVFGPHHALYGQAELNAGFALARLGRIDEALGHYRAARAAYAAVNHFDEGSALRYAAGALLTLERWSLAEQALLEAETVLERHLGADAELVLAARLNRATALAELGRHDEAAALAQAAFERAQATLGAETSTVRNGLRVLGTIRRGQGRHDEAVALLERLVDGERRVAGDEGAPAAQARVQLARALLARDRDGDRARARGLLDAAIPVLAEPGRSPLLHANALLDRADLMVHEDRAAATADRDAARAAVVGVPTLPPSIARRLAEN
jgi:serine/threonine-protein kinase